MTTRQLVPNSAMLTQQTKIASHKSIISADLGRTATKACVSRNPNGVVFIPANVANMPVEKVRGGSLSPKQQTLCWICG